MKTRRYDILIALLFCLFLGGMLLAFLLLPKHSFSVREKRYLAEAPKLSWRNVASGVFSDAAETYAAEHLPGRNTLVGLNALYDLLSGRQVTKEILRGRDGRLFEAPAPFDTGIIRRHLAAINGFAEATDHDYGIPDYGTVKLYLRRGDGVYFRSYPEAEFPSDIFGGHGGIAGFSSYIEELMSSEKEQDK